LLVLFYGGEVRVPFFTRVAIASRPDDDDRQLPRGAPVATPARKKTTSTHNNNRLASSDRKVGQSQKYDGRSPWSRQVPSATCHMPHERKTDRRGADACWWGGG
jgi:hypothetical protein